MGARGILIQFGGIPDENDYNIKWYVKMCVTRRCRERKVPENVGGRRGNVKWYKKKKKKIAK